ncbi:MAG: response regulator [Ectothiorhodospiraceae bacterium]|nr:response regulator [Ectothiorhodospiraceae bacterium]
MAIRGFLETVLWRVAPLAFLVLAGGWYLGQSTAWRVVQNQASEQLAHHGEMLTVRLRRRLETATRDVVHLATNRLLVNALIDPEGRQHYLAPLLRSAATAAGPRAKAFLTDYRGRVLAASSSQGALPEAGWIEQTMRGEVVLDVDQAGMLIVAPVWHDGAPEGALVVMLDGAAVGDWTDTGDAALDVVVSGGDGVVVYSSNPTIAVAGKTLRAMSSDWLASPGQPVGIDGLSLLVASPVEVATGEFAVLGRLLGHTALLGVLVFMGGVTAATLLATRRVRRVVDDLHFIAARDTAGSRVAPGDAEEFLELSAAINRLLEHLERATVSREQVDLAFDAMREMVVLVGVDGHIMSANRITRETLDLGARRIHRLPIALLWREGDPDAGRLPGQGDPPLETTWQGHGGEAVPVRIHVRELGPEAEHRRLVVAEDMRAHHRAEHRFRTLLESAPDPIVIVGPGGRLVLVNGATERLFGYSRDDLLLVTLDRLVPTGLPVSIRRGDLSLEPGAGGTTIEASGVRADGTRVPLELVAASVDTELGPRVCVTIRDVTEHKLLEAELRDARDAALEAVEVKGAFLAKMSHELRTPMNGVLGVLDLMSDVELDEEHAQLLGLARHGAQSLLETIDEILDISKIEAGKLVLEEVDFDLRTVAEDAVAMVAHQASQAGVALGCVVDAELPGLVRGDPLRLRQALVNLLSNALRFTPKGEVRLAVEVEWARADAMMVSLEVSDTGVGITRAQQTQIFDAFTQADDSTTRSHGGTGLGLAITAGLVDLMGGRIDLQSRPGVGSSFKLRLPLVPGVGPAPARPCLPDLVDYPVLLVSARPAIVDSVLAVLRGAGLDPAVVDDAVAASIWLERRDGGASLLLIDTTSVAAEAASSRQALDRVVRRRAAATLHLDEPVRRAIDGPAPTARLLWPARRDALVEAVRKLAVGSAPDAEVRPARRLAGRVLLAEDNETNRRVVSAMLERAGLSVVAAGNGREAVETALRRRFDVVLMDCHMPEADGLSATREIREHERREGLPRLPILALTANVRREDREQCLAAGMDGYLGKPIRRDDLLDAIARVLDDAGVGPSIDPQTPETATPEDAEAPGDNGGTSTMTNDSEATPIIDVDALEALASELGPDMEELIQTYIEDSAGLLDRLGAALEQGDTQGVVIAAHSLGSTSELVGARVLSRLGRSVEVAAKSGDLEPGRQALAEMRTLRAASCEALDAFGASLASPTRLAV